MYNIVAKVIGILLKNQSDYLISQRYTIFAILTLKIQRNAEGF